MLESQKCPDDENWIFKRGSKRGLFMLMIICQYFWYGDFAKSCCNKPWHFAQFEYIFFFFI